MSQPKWRVELVNGLPVISYPPDAQPPALTPWQWDGLLSRLNEHLDHDAILRWLDLPAKGA